MTHLDSSTNANNPRIDLIVAALLATIAIAASVAVITVGVCGVYHDDGLYVSTAKALAEGRGYRLIDLPGAPFQTKYPVLYPAALAVIWRLWPAFPNNLLAMQGLSLLMGAAVIVAGYLYAVRVQRCRPLVAGLALALCATSPQFAYFSTQTLSEIPFALCLIVTMWMVAAEQERAAPSRARYCAIGTAVGAPCLLRLIGFAIVVPVLLSLWRRDRRLTRYAVAGLLPVAAWLAWVWIARHDAASIKIATNYPDYWEMVGRDAWHATRRVVGFNSLMLTTATADMFPGSWKAHVPIAFPILGVVTWFGVARHGRLTLATALLSYAAVVLVWPWPSARFLLPLWPLLAPFTLEPIHRRLGAIAVVIVVGLAMGGNLIALYDMSLRNRATGYPTLAAMPSPPSWPAYERLFAWTRAHSDPEDVLIAGIDPMLFLYTGRPAIRAFDAQPLPLFYGGAGAPLGTVTELSALLARYRGRYLVQTAMPGFFEEAPFNDLVRQIERERPLCLTPVYQDERDARFAVLRINATDCGEAGVEER